MNNKKKIAWLAVVVLALAGCGGGGSGSGSSSSSGGGGSGNGDFTLSTGKAAFRAPNNGTAPDPVAVHVNVTGSGVYQVVAGFPVENQPDWLVLDFQGGGSSFDLVMSVAGQSGAPGKRTAKVIVGTQDSAGRWLKQRDIDVTLDTFQGLRFTSNYTDRNYVYGATDSDSAQFTVEAAGKSWKLSSDASWAQVSTVTQTGNGTAQVTLDVTRMDPFGVGVAHVTATNVADPADRHAANIVVNVSPPPLTVSPAEINVGGEFGTDPLTLDATITLGTGANRYPVTITPTIAPITGQLTLNAPTTIGESASTLTVGAANTVTAGIYSGTLRVTANVHNQTFTRDVPLKVTRESQRLFPSADGVALNSFPAHSVLSRELTIAGSHGQTGVPWTAVSSSPWLTVSPTSGVTGDKITLTAAPGGLAGNQFHEATVTVTSTDPRIERAESVRVGLWKATAEPPAVLTQDLQPRHYVADPVGPWVYLLTADGKVQVRQVYSGDLVAEFTPGITGRGTLATSGDGRKLYVSDSDGLRVLELDAATGAQLRVFPMANGSSAFNDDRGPVMLVTKMSAHPVLYPPFASGPSYLGVVEPIDLETEQPLVGYISGGGRSIGDNVSIYTNNQFVSPDGEYRYIGENYNISVYRRRFTTIHPEGAGFIFIPGLYYAWGVTSVWSTCAGDDGRVYVVGNDYEVAVREANLALATPASISLPSQAFGILCRWDGRKYLLTNPTAVADPNLLVLNAAGSIVGGTRLGVEDDSFAIGRAILSGDGGRIMFIAVGGGAAVWKTYAAP